MIFKYLFGHPPMSLSKKDLCMRFCRGSAQQVGQINTTATHISHVLWTQRISVVSSMTVVTSSRGCISASMSFCDWVPRSVLLPIGSLLLHSQISARRVNYWLVTMLCDFFFSIVNVFLHFISFIQEWGVRVFPVSLQSWEFHLDFLLDMVGCGPANPMEICGNFRQIRLTFDLCSLLKVFLEYLT